jgi:uncharacterized integral membrane protein
MMDEKYRELLAGYVDGELTPEERVEFEAKLARDPVLKAEFEEFQRLKEVTNRMQYADIPDEVWQSYWQSVYRKTERGVGWILMSAGAIILLCFALFETFSNLFANPDAPLWLKIGLPTMVVGAVILLVSYVRERIFAYHRERYREVMK